MGKVTLAGITSRSTCPFAIFPFAVLPFTLSPTMNQFRRLLIPVLVLLITTAAFCSAYNARPKLVVVIVVDQLRGDMIERYHDQFVEGGFRLLMDRGAWFSSCYYNYANLRTAPGHSTIGTGTYSLGHGIFANEWYDPTQKKVVSSVEDSTTKLLGAEVGGSGSSPHNLLSDTIGDELKLATGGKARVFGVALKDRAAILPVGFSADAAFWIDHDNGAWLTSTYYAKAAPDWVLKFNTERRGEKYANISWKDSEGKVLRSTALEQNGKKVSFYDAVGATPFAADYTFEFVRELVDNEKLGSGPNTDLLVVSLSNNDILQHKVGPDSPQEKELMLATDRQLAAFFAYLGRQVGLANVAIALTADHGGAPAPDYAKSLRIPADGFDPKKFRADLNRILSTKLGKTAEYVRGYDHPNVYLDETAFAAVNIQEAAAEIAAGEALKQLGALGYVTKSQLAAGDVPNTVFREKYLNSYSPYGPWYVFSIPRPFLIGYTTGTDHSLPYTYDTHVPLAFFGVSFKPGQYREKVETVDLAATIASLLGINPPASAVGRPLHEAFVDARPQETTR
jgi:predicted AlkP superfamily pyrophosphatase or phosphodiesterase